MNKNFKNFVWILFLIIIPLVYIVIKILLPNLGSLELIITISSYLIAILALMYKIDLKFYFWIQSILLIFKYNFTSWVLSARYNTINDAEIIKKLETLFSSLGTKIITRNEGYLCILWDSRNVLNIRYSVESPDEKNLHLYTSKIDVPIKENKRKIKELSQLFEKIENAISQSDRNNKRYDIDIEYSGKSPFYSYWIKCLPEEKIYNFNCTVKIDDNEGTIGVNKNHVYINAASFSDLFQRLDFYLTLRSIS